MITEKRNTADSNTYKTSRVIEAYYEVLAELQQATVGGRRVNLTTHLSRSDIYEQVRVRVGFYSSIQTISKIIRAHLKEQKKG